MLCSYVSGRIVGFLTPFSHHFLGADAYNGEKFVILPLMSDSRLTVWSVCEDLILILNNLHKATLAPHKNI